MYDLLKDLRIVEGSAFVAAPLGGMTLAQLGADVIRFDPVGGGLDYKRWPVTEQGQSLYWSGLNKGKRSIAIDLRSPEGKELAVSLITGDAPNAGIFLTNFPQSDWLDYTALKKRRDDLIMVQVQGTPDGGSAVDYTINSATGIPYATGPVDDPAPVNHMFPAWDALTGINAALAVVVAERQRRLTGSGQLVRLALSDIAFSMVGNLGHIAEAQINGAQRQAIGNRLYGAFGHNFRTRDGHEIMLVAITRRQWRNLVTASQLEQEFNKIETERGLQLDREGDRYQATDSIIGLLEPWCARYDLAKLASIFDSHGVCWGPYQTFSELVNHDPRCSDKNPVFSTVLQPGIGEYLMPGSPLRFEAEPRKQVTPAPQLGADTDEILATILGLSAAAIGGLHDRGIIAGITAD